MVVTLKDFRPAARVAFTALLGLLTVPLSALPARAAVEIAPHRAIYKMSLASARNSSIVSDVRGQMMFEWADACDGWTIEQRFQLRFQYSEGEQVDMTTNYATWESKDGQTYRFNVRKLVNGELDEELRGTAEAHGDRPGVARYLKPEEQEIELPGGTLFPSMHTIELLKRAAAGDKLFGTTVFDGSDTEEPPRSARPWGCGRWPRRTGSSTPLPKAPSGRSAWRSSPWTATRPLPSTR